MHHSAMSVPVTGQQRYERVLNGAFVLQHWTYDHPAFPDAVALLPDDQYHYFGVRGITRVFNLEIDNDGWSMIRLDEDFSLRRAGLPDALVLQTGQLLLTFLVGYLHAELGGRLHRAVHLAKVDAAARHGARYRTLPDLPLPATDDDATFDLALDLLIASLRRDTGAAARS